MKLKYIYFFKFFLILLSISTISYCQSIPDYSTLTSDFIDTLIKNQVTEQELIVIPVPVELSLRIYYTVNANGDSNITKNDIELGLSKLNASFQPIEISFSILKLIKIKNPNYCIIDSLLEKDEVITKFSEKNTINVYLFDELTFNNINYSGLTYFPNEPDKPYILLIKQDFTQSGLIHLMGHFFGLLHTHENIHDKEFVNGTNCKVAGDLICDTYADPNLFNKVEGCEYIMYDYDTNGEDYIPSVANFMSFSPQECKCNFSEEQYRRMLFYYRNYRKYLK